MYAQLRIKCALDVVEKKLEIFFIAVASDSEKKLTDI